MMRSRPPDSVLEAPSVSRRRRWLLALASRCVVAISLVFLAATLVAGYNELPSISWEAAGLVSVGVAVLLAILAVLVSGFGWVSIVRGGVPGLDMIDGLIVVGRSGVAKYAPGNVLHYVGRATGVRAFGVPASVAIGATVAEAALVTFGALAIGLLGRAGDLDKAANAMPGLGGRLLITSSALAVVGTSAVVVFLASRRAQLLLNPVLRVIHAVPLVVALSAYIASQLLLGVALLSILDLMFSSPTQPPPGAIISASALAWVAGFLTPGSPGGLGVREAVFVALAGPEMGDELALAGILVLRLCTVAADLAVFLLATAVARRLRTSAARRVGRAGRC